MKKEDIDKRDSEISLAFDLQEQGKATQDDYWDAIFPSLEWCEYELKQLGFESDYDELYEMLGHIPCDDLETFQKAERQFRLTTPDIDSGLGNDDRATVITALRYRERYKTSGGKRVCFGTIFISP